MKELRLLDIVILKSWVKCQSTPSFSKFFLSNFVFQWENILWLPSTKHRRVFTFLFIGVPSAFLVFFCYRCNDQKTNIKELYRNIFNIQYQSTKISKILLNSFISSSKYNNNKHQVVIQPKNKSGSLLLHRIIFM